jgi:hypothetical protein
MRRGGGAPTVCMTYLKRSWLAIVVTVVSSFISRSVGKMTSISQKARASLVGCKQGSRWMRKDAPDQYAGLLSGFYDSLQVLRVLSVPASLQPRQHHL